LRRPGPLAAVLGAALVLAPAAARAAGEPPPPLVTAAPAALRLVPAFGLRLGLAGRPLGTGDVAPTPRLGLVAALAIGRHLEVHLAWDATFGTGGTSVVSVRSVDHVFSLVADGRLVLHGPVALVAGLGPGLAVDVIGSRAPTGSVTTVTVSPALVWDAGLDLRAGRLGIRLGVEGRVGRLGHQVGFLVGVRYRLHNTGT
jgi:hypothetical protein